jgi:hypothetical protein
VVFKRKMEMKAAKIALVSIIILLGISGVALAHTNVSVGIGVGYPSFYGGYGWGHHHRSSVIIGGYWGYPHYPDYYHYPPPVYYAPPPPLVVIERPPVLVERPPVAQPAQPVPQSRDTQELYDSLRNKKRELLRVLVIGDKQQRIRAINELAGFSFDDNVRLALEKVLLSDGDPDLRLTAAKAFGLVKNHKAVSALEIARVQDPVTEVRIAADQSIKKLQEK